MFIRISLTCFALITMLCGCAVEPGELPLDTPLPEFTDKRISRDGMARTEILTFAANTGKIEEATSPRGLSADGSIWFWNEARREGQTTLDEVQRTLTLRSGKLRVAGRGGLDAVSPGGNWVGRDGSGIILNGEHAAYSSDVHLDRDEIQFLSINDDKVIAGTINEGFPSGNPLLPFTISFDNQHAAIWHVQEGVAQIDRLHGLPDRKSEVIGVDNRGRVLVRVYGNDRHPAEQSYIWQNDRATAIRGSNGEDVYAVAMNAEGAVIGSMQTENGLRHAFIWKNGEIHDLGTG